MVSIADLAFESGRWSTAARGFSICLWKEKIHETLTLTRLNSDRRSRRLCEYVQIGLANFQRSRASEAGPSEASAMRQKQPAGSVCEQLLVGEAALFGSALERPSNYTSLDMLIKELLIHLITIAVEQIIADGQRNSRKLQAEEQEVQRREQREDQEGAERRKYSIRRSKGSQAEPNCRECLKSKP